MSGKVEEISALLSRLTKDHSLVESSGPSTEEVLFSTKCRPWDIKDFKRRLSTFGIDTWFASNLSPLECSRRGWVNCSGDMLECEVCRARMLLPPRTPLLGACGVDAAGPCQAQLDTLHKAHCPWKDNLCPAHFLCPPDDKVGAVFKRIELLLESPLPLPPVSETFLEELHADENWDCAFSKIQRDLIQNGKAVTSEQLQAALALALGGWQPVAGDDDNGDASAGALLCCDLCQRVPCRRTAAAPPPVDSARGKPDSEVDVDIGIGTEVETEAAAQAIAGAGAEAEVEVDAVRMDDDQTGEDADDGATANAAEAKAETSTEAEVGSAVGSEVSAVETVMDNDEVLPLVQADTEAVVEAGAEAVAAAAAEAEDMTAAAPLRLRGGAKMKRRKSKGTKQKKNTKGKGKLKAKAKARAKASAMLEKAVERMKDDSEEEGKNGEAYEGNGQSEAEEVEEESKSKRESEDADGKPSDWHPATEACTAAATTERDWTIPPPLAEPGEPSPLRRRGTMAVTAQEGAALLQHLGGSPATRLRFCADVDAAAAISGWSRDVDVCEGVDGVPEEEGDAHVSKRARAELESEETKKASLEEEEKVKRRRIKDQDVDQGKYGKDETDKEVEEVSMDESEGSVNNTPRRASDKADDTGTKSELSSGEKEDAEDGDIEGSAEDNHDDQSNEGEKDIIRRRLLDAEFACDQKKSDSSSSSSSSSSGSSKYYSSRSSSSSRSSGSGSDSDISSGSSNESEGGFLPRVAARQRSWAYQRIDRPTTRHEPQVITILSSDSETEKSKAEAAKSGESSDEEALEGEAWPEDSGSDLGDESEEAEVHGREDLGSGHEEESEASGTEESKSKTEANSSSGIESGERIAQRRHYTDEESTSSSEEQIEESDSESKTASSESEFMSETQKMSESGDEASAEEKRSSEDFTVADDVRGDEVVPDDEGCKPVAGMDTEAGTGSSEEQVNRGYEMISLSWEKLLQIDPSFHVLDEHRWYCPWRTEWRQVLRAICVAQSMQDSPMRSSLGAVQQMLKSITQ